MQLSHHTLSDEILTNTKPLVFLLDNPKSVKEEDDDQGEDKKKKRKKSKKQGKSSGSIKNFGAFVDISSLKNSASIEIAWRCRCLAQQIPHGKLRVVNIKIAKQKTGLVFLPCQD